MYLLISQPPDLRIMIRFLLMVRLGKTDIDMEDGMVWYGMVWYADSYLKRKKERKKERKVR